MVQYGGDERIDLDERIEAELRKKHDELLTKGELLSDDVLAACYRRFRERFGPDALAGLDGERLLLTMHERGTHDSLVYWIEFKDDEEMPRRFGSISGGSALKFGIYQSAETGKWMAGRPLAQVQLSLDEAIQRAREQRDQLIAGAAVLERAQSSRRVDYELLQAQMMEAAPGVAESAWGHKYFSLLYPNIVDDYHATDHQRHHALKLLQTPRQGRYVSARTFVLLAKQLGMQMVNLGTVLNQRNGSPCEYWRVSTEIEGIDAWERMRKGGYIALGWARLGDLSSLPGDKAGKARLRALIEENEPELAQASGTGWQHIFKFVTHANVRDVVVAMRGPTVVGVGKVTGPYYHTKEAEAHRLPVEWLNTDEWTPRELESQALPFQRLDRPVSVLLDIERRLLAPTQRDERAQSVRPEAVSAPPSLTGVLARVHAALQRKGQVVLYGPPGTGKTYWADRALRELAARAWFGKSAEQLTRAEEETLRTQGAVTTCAFHPSFGYEDFLEGYRPIVREGQLAFERRDGLFKQLCQRASADPERPYFLLIDEFNRGDVPRIFGDLLTTLEHDKRGKPLRLPLSGEEFAVPTNVNLVATMNTADRSIALLDAALRRRFAFIELLPDSGALRGVSVGGLPLGAWLDELNARIITHVGSHARNLQVGHAYLLPHGVAIRDVSRFVEVLRDDIIPLLEEYCYEDFSALAQILGGVVVDVSRRRIDSSLFEPERNVELITALLSSFDKITATRQAVDADQQDDAEEGDEQDEV